MTENKNTLVGCGGALAGIVCACVFKGFCLAIGFIFALKLFGVEL